MSSFLEFYLAGGLFMHVITLCGLLAAASLVRALWVRMSTRVPAGIRHGTAEQINASVGLANGLTLLCVGIGVLGTLTGVLESAVAASEAAPAAQLPVFLRGLSLATYTLGWSLASALPLWCLTLYVRYVHRWPPASASAI